MKMLTTVVVLFLVIVMTACHSKVRIGDRLQTLVDTNSNLIFSLESYSEVTEQNREGSTIKGLNFAGVRLIEAAADLDKVTNRMFLIIDHPVATGLLKYAYLERKRQRSNISTAPIRFLDYQSAWIVKVDDNESICDVQRREFGYVIISLGDSAFPTAITPENRDEGRERSKDEPLPATSD